MLCAALIIVGLIHGRQQPAEWRAGIRVRDEREHSAKVLADERKAADDRLRAQMDHSAAQLQAEHDLAREQEQLDQAYAVVVVLGEREDAGPVFEDVGDSDVRTLVLMIANKGKYTITRVEAQFSPDGQSLLPHDISTPITDLDKLPDVLRAGQPGRTEWAYGNVLTSWDAGMHFEAQGIHKKHISAPYAVVRWTDRWNQRWEHKRGQVQRIDESYPWKP
jgi:hypothetical protein